MRSIIRLKTARISYRKSRGQVAGRQAASQQASQACERSPTGARPLLEWHAIPPHLHWRHRRGDAEGWGTTRRTGGQTAIAPAADERGFPNGLAH